MTQEEKDLLLKDICARLPYAPIIKIEKHDWNNINIDVYETSFRSYYLEPFIIGEIEIKPYLRPMSSMTEEEDKEWQYYKNKIAESCDELLEERIADCHNFFNAHHFDYRCLIDKGLAVEVTKENNPYV